MLQLLKHLFRLPLLKKRLPLLPSTYSSDTLRGYVPAGRERDIDLLIGHGLARRREDAGRILAAHPTWTVEEIVRRVRHERRREPRLALAWERFKRLW